jgi:hypothetical protein
MTSRIGFPLLALLLAAGCSGSDATDPRSAGRSGSTRAVGQGLDVEVSKSFPRSGSLHVTKECSTYTGLAGSFCTITSSNVKEIEVGSKVIYTVGAGATLLDTDITLDLPGSGNNKAFGHCRLNLLTGVGRCSFSGGTGKFTHLSADAAVSYLGGPNWAWEGTYNFSPRD